MKYSKIFIKVISIFIVLGFIFSNTNIYAQTNSVDIVVNVSPEHPKPYEDVTVSLESYSTDLNKALIEWKGGSKTFLKNTGATDFSFKMGDLGTQAILDVKITAAEGDFIQKRIILTPTDMDMLWQAVDSHVPPFYRGKALPPKEGKIKITAIPAGKNGIQTTNTTYTWKLNNQTQQDQSGYKKNSFIFNLSNTEKVDKIEVVSNTTTGSTTASGNMEISGINPFILFYKKSPSEGILYNNILPSQMFLIEDEMTLAAEPYFMGSENGENENAYSWRINGEEIDTPRNKNMLTIRPTGRGGYAKINLEIENTLKLFQKVAKELTIDL